MDETLSTLKLPKATIMNVEQLGPASADINSRTRTLKVTLSSIFDKRTALANAHLLKGLSVLVRMTLVSKER